MSDLAVGRQCPIRGVPVSREVAREQELRDAGVECEVGLLVDVDDPQLEFVRRMAIVQDTAGDQADLQRDAIGAAAEYAQMGESRAGDRHDLLVEGDLAVLQLDAGPPRAAGAVGPQTKERQLDGGVDRGQRRALDIEQVQADALGVLAEHGVPAAGLQRGLDWSGARVDHRWREDARAEPHGEVVIGRRGRGVVRLLQGQVLPEALVTSRCIGWPVVSSVM